MRKSSEGSNHAGGGLTTFTEKEKEEYKKKGIGLMRKRLDVMYRICKNGAWSTVTKDEIVDLARYWFGRSPDRREAGAKIIVEAYDHYDIGNKSIGLVMRPGDAPSSDVVESGDGTSGSSDSDEREESGVDGGGGDDERIEWNANDDDAAAASDDDDGEGVDAEGDEGLPPEVQYAVKAIRDYTKTHGRAVPQGRYQRLQPQFRVHEASNVWLEPEIPRGVNNDSYYRKRVMFLFPTKHFPDRDCKAASPFVTPTETPLFLRLILLFCRTLLMVSVLMTVTVIVKVMIVRQLLGGKRVGNG